MGGLVAGLAGAGGAANTVGGYYQNALGQLVNAYGSPAASQFGQMEQRSLQPMFNQQDQQLAAQEAAMGITGSGAAKNDLGNLGAQQSSVLAGSIAPLYSQALGQYGSILGGEPGAQAGAYQGAINNLYQGIGGLGGLAGDYFTGGMSGGIPLGGSYGQGSQAQPLDTTTPFSTDPGATFINGQNLSAPAPPNYQAPNPYSYNSGSSNYNPYSTYAPEPAYPGAPSGGQ